MIGIAGPFENEIKRPSKHLIKEVYEEKQFAEKVYMILIPIKNIANAGDLASLANIVTKEKNGHIVIHSRRSTCIFCS